MTRRKILIDCGTHLGMGCSQMIKHFEMDQEWEIFGFEANPYVFDAYVKGVVTSDETRANRRNMTLEELKEKTQEALQLLHDLPNLTSLDKITCNVSAILADKLYDTHFLKFPFSIQQKQSLQYFIRKQTSLYKNATAIPSLTHVVRRIFALYSLASQMPKDVPSSTFEEAVKCVHQNLFPRPELAQSVYAFIAAELLLIKSCGAPIEEIQQKVLLAYKEALTLPILGLEDKDLLEIIIWKIVSETEGFLEKLPYRIGQKIEEEIASILIDDPKKGFSSIVHETVQFFQRAKELTETKKWANVSKKIHLWCIQNDMLCRSIRLNLDSALAKIVQKFFQEKGKSIHCHFRSVSEICQSYLSLYPSACIYMNQLHSRAWILYKYLWFTSFSKENESSFDSALISDFSLYPSYSTRSFSKLCRTRSALCPRRCCC